MQKIIFAALLLAAFSYANKLNVCDTIFVKQTVIDTVHKINVVPDSEIWTHSQQFYKDAFSDLLCAAGIILAIIAVIFGLSQFFISKLNVDKLKEDIAKKAKEIENLGKHIDGILDILEDKREIDIINNLANRVTQTEKEIKEIKEAK